MRKRNSIFDKHVEDEQLAPVTELTDDSVLLHFDDRSDKRDELL